MKSMILLDTTGDTTIVWDEDTEDALLPIIKKKMDAGVIFYVLKPRVLSILPPKKVRAKKVADIRKAGAVVIHDSDLNALFEKGAIHTIKSDNDNIVTVRKAKTARDVVSNDTVAIRPARGG